MLNGSRKLIYANVRILELHSNYLNRLITRLQVSQYLHIQSAAILEETRVNLHTFNAIKLRIRVKTDQK